MKKIISLLALATLAACFISCDTMNGPATVTTGEATDVSIEGYTFNGTIEFNGYSGCLGYGGFFYNNKPDVSSSNYLFTTQTQNLKDGTNNLTYSAKNYIENIVGLRTYYIKAGETMYYRAYAKILSGGSTDEYIYGEEKSVVITY